MPKQRTHNEWFRTVSLGNRKSCPTCKCRLAPNEHIWSWGEYHNAKWRTVKHFCRQCYIPEVQTPLSSHTTDCGCAVELCLKSDTQPDWLTLNVPTCEMV